MTEAEWLTSTTNPGVMLDCLRSPNLRRWRNDRKLRLLAVACASRILPRASDSDRAGFVEALALAERFAERKGTEVELSNIRRFGPTPWTWAIKIALHTCHLDAQTAARSAVVSAGKFVGEKVKEGPAAKKVELRVQSELIRCVLGNPFRPASVDPAWRTSDVLALAQQMYDSRDFGAMPILADALQDAGCDNVNVLDHCRDPGEHVRGCWVIDLLLGK